MQLKKGGPQWKKANCSTRSGLAYDSGILACELNKHISIGSNDLFCSTINAILVKWGKKRSKRFYHISLCIGKVSASTQNQAFNALLFLYRTLFGRELGHIENVVRANRPRRLPVVFTKEEVQAILNAAARNRQIDRKLALWLRLPPPGMPQTPSEGYRFFARTHHRARGKEK